MANINDPNPFNNFSEGYEDFGSGGKRHLERKIDSFIKQTSKLKLNRQESEDRTNQLNLMNRRAFTTHARQPKLRQTAMEILDPRKGWSDYNRDYAINGLTNARNEKRKAKWPDIIPPHWGNMNRRLPPGPDDPEKSWRYLTDKKKMEKKEKSKIGDNYLLYRPRKHSYNW